MALYSRLLFANFLPCLPRSLSTFLLSYLFSSLRRVPFFPPFLFFPFPLYFFPRPADFRLAARNSAWKFQANRDAIIIHEKNGYVFNAFGRQRSPASSPPPSRGVDYNGPDFLINIYEFNSLTFDWSNREHSLAARAVRPSWWNIKLIIRGDTVRFEEIQKLRIARSWRVIPRRESWQHGRGKLRSISLKNKKFSFGFSRLAGSHVLSIDVCANVLLIISYSPSGNYLFRGSSRIWLDRSRVCVCALFNDIQQSFR